MAAANKVAKVASIKKKLLITTPQLVVSVTGELVRSSRMCYKLYIYIKKKKTLVLKTIVNKIQF